MGNHERPTLGFPGAAGGSGASGKVARGYRFLGRSGPRSIRGAPTGAPATSGNAPGAALPDLQRCDFARAGTHSPLEFTENAPGLRHRRGQATRLWRNNLAI